MKHDSKFPPDLPDVFDDDPPPFRLDVLALMLGASLGVWTVAVVAVVKFWPAIEGWMR